MQDIHKHAAKLPSLQILVMAGKAFSKVAQLETKLKELWPQSAIFDTKLASSKSRVRMSDSWVAETVLICFAGSQPTHHDVPFVIDTIPSRAALCDNIATTCVGPSCAFRAKCGSLSDAPEDVADTGMDDYMNNLLDQPSGAAPLWAFARPVATYVAALRGLVPAKDMHSALILTSTYSPNALIAFRKFLQERQLGTLSKSIHYVCKEDPHKQLHCEAVLKYTINQEILSKSQSAGFGTRLRCSLLSSRLKLR